MCFFIEGVGRHCKRVKGEKLGISRKQTAKGISIEEGRGGLFPLRPSLRSDGASVLLRLRLRVCVLLRSACARLICKVSKKIVIFSGFRFQGVILAK